MTDTAIRVENLSKLYRIGRAQQRHDTLRDALVDFLPRITRINTKNNRKIRGIRVNSWQKENDDTIWALKGVSFEVRRGEVVGIIGRNGAGKTTLLKILSRITKPTEGRAIINGRVGSLLEVGTGFHPELTGRENIYLNGAILGMKRAEIERKFDEIVDFSGVEKFIDTPVKRYSSGMYVRLAFAVAAHLEPEILLVDEVLAVGDATFQKKCLGKMGEVAGKGRTVLFVSHNMNAVANLCTRTILLKEGYVLRIGTTEHVVDQYFSEMEVGSTANIAEREDRSGSGRLRFTDYRVLDSWGAPIDFVKLGQEIWIEFDYQSQNETLLDDVSVSLGFYDIYGRVLSLLGNDISSAGRYQANVYCEVRGLVADWVRNAFVVEVVEGDYFQTGTFTKVRGGVILMPHKWDYNTWEDKN